MGIVHKEHTCFYAGKTLLYNKGKKLLKLKKNTQVNKDEKKKKKGKEGQKD